MGGNSWASPFSGCIFLVGFAPRGFRSLLQVCRLGSLVAAAGLNERGRLFSVLVLHAVCIEQVAARLHRS